jgi:hypothetical protein
MIDTIRITIQRETLPDNYIDSLEPKLVNSEFSIRKDGSIKLTGNIRNFFVSVNNSTMVLYGSLTKYAMGDNLKSADKSELRDAVKNLGKELGIDLFQAGIGRLDIGGNIITKYPTDEYYPLLIDINRLNRKIEPNGLSFGNTVRYVSFYGKIKEMASDRNINIDKDFISTNILRYEYRLMRKKTISSFLKIANPTVEDIFNNYDYLVTSWVKIFNSIHKNKDLLEPPLDLFLKRGEFDRFIRRKGIESIGGAEHVLKMIQIAKARKYFVKYPSEVSNLKRNVKKLMNGPSHLMKKSTLINELEDKIHSISFCALSHEITI